MDLTLYDKASWHIDAAEPANDVIERFRKIINWCNAHNSLSAEGMELISIGIDDSISLHSRLFTATGNKFMQWMFDATPNPYGVEEEKMEEKLLEISKQ